MRDGNVRIESTIEARKRRIDRAHAILKSLGKCEYGKAMALISLNVGVSEAKAREYINALKTAGLITTEGGDVKA
jgi:predicted transcriptional regulator